MYSVLALVCVVNIGGIAGNDQCAEMFDDKVYATQYECNDRKQEYILELNDTYGVFKEPTKYKTMCIYDGELI